MVSGDASAMMKLLLELIRDRPRMLGGPGSILRLPWKRVFEKSFGRRVSAPSHRLCAITDIGKRRHKNEDAYFLSGDCRLWIVADGMGGHAAGEIASTLTIQAIVDSLASTAATPNESSAVDIGERLRTAFADAQEQVRLRSQHDRLCHGMGSTAVVGLVNEELLYLCHIGDARGYHFSDGQLRRLTDDHSLVWELVVSGLLTPDQARSHPQRATITQAIGMLAGVKPAVTNLTLKPGDRVLLCSDGLWEALAERDIGEIVGSAGSMLELTAKLVDRANAASGQDNITAVLYEHGCEGHVANRGQS